MICACRLTVPDLRRSPPSPLPPRRWSKQVDGTQPRTFYEACRDKKRICPPSSNSSFLLPFFPFRIWSAQTPCPPFHAHRCSHQPHTSVPNSCSADSGEQAHHMNRKPAREARLQTEAGGAAARALRNCLTFQVLLLFLAPCWVHVSFFGYFSRTLCIWKEKLQPVSVTLGEMWSAFTGGI